MPHISVSIPQSGQLLSYDISEGLTILELKSFINAETGFPVNAQILYLNGRSLTNDTQTLQDAGIRNNDMLAAEIRVPRRQRQQGTDRPPQQSRSGPESSQDDLNASIEAFRQELLGNLDLREELATEAPEAANAVNDPQRFREAYVALYRARQEHEAQRLARLISDEVNEENQAEIAEFIRIQNVEKERESALYEYPELFAPVNMLYIDMEVNGHPVKAYVDSGAQVTTISPSCAEACGITRLMDTRIQGIVSGVGTSKILGKVYQAPVHIGDAELPCAFTVVENKVFDVLLGLDMLRRYQVSIDLYQNRLVLQGGVSVPFLAESEIPKRFQEALENEPTISAPGGINIGAETGAVKAAPHPPAAATESSVAASSSTDLSGPDQSLDPVASPIPRPQAPTPTQAGPEFPQESIDALERIGATHAQALEALRACGGNVELAAGIIYDQY